MVSFKKPSGVRVILDQRAIRAVLISQDGPVARDMLARGHRVLARAQRLVGVDTGRLRASLRVRRMTVGGAPAVRVETDVYYARWHHDGTGIYGPRRQVIRPVRARALRFTPKGANAPIFRAYVRGAPGTFFLTRALEAAADPEWVGRIGPGRQARAWASGLGPGPAARTSWAQGLSAGPRARTQPQAQTRTRRRRNPFRRRR